MSVAPGFVPTPVAPAGLGPAAPGLPAAAVAAEGPAVLPPDGPPPVAVAACLPLATDPVDEPADRAAAPVRTAAGPLVTVTAPPPAGVRAPEAASAVAAPLSV